MVGALVGWRGRVIFDNVLDMIEDRRERRRIGDKPEEESIDTWLHRVEDEHTLAEFHAAGLYLGSEPWPGEARTGITRYVDTPAGHAQQMQLRAMLQGSPSAFTGLGPFGHGGFLGALQAPQCGPQYQNHLLRCLFGTC